MPRRAGLEGGLTARRARANNPYNQWHFALDEAYTSSGVAARLCVSSSEAISGEVSAPVANGGLEEGCESRLTEQGNRARRVRAYARGETVTKRHAFRTASSARRVERVVERFRETHPPHP